MTCFECNSSRLISISSKASNLCFVQFEDTEIDGYLPDDLGIGGEDYVEFEYCLSCGQIQGKWPLPQTNIEQGILEEDDWDEEDYGRPLTKAQKIKIAKEDEHDSPIISLAQLRNKKNK